MKKKSLLFVVISVFALLLTGCGNKEEVKTLTCSRSMNQDEIKTSLNYTVSYKGKYVTNVKSVETIESDDSSLLEAYKSQVESTYSPYKNVEHYNYEVKVDGNKLTSTADINYEKIDTEKLIDIDSANGSLIKDGKILVSDIKSVYEQIGATCK